MDSINAPKKSVSLIELGDLSVNQHCFIILTWCYTTVCNMSRHHFKFQLFSAVVSSEIQSPEHISKQVAEKKQKY